jgi:hypothetical protein
MLKNGPTSSSIPKNSTRDIEASRKLLQSQGILVSTVRTRDNHSGRTDQILSAHFPAAAIISGASCMQSGVRAARITVAIAAGKTVSPEYSVGACSLWKEMRSVALGNEKGPKIARRLRHAGSGWGVLFIFLSDFTGQRHPRIRLCATMPWGCKSAIQRCMDPIWYYGR